jgi:hypothetical protein
VEDTDLARGLMGGITTIGYCVIICSLARSRKRIDILRLHDGSRSQFMRRTLRKQFCGQTELILWKNHDRRK